MEGSLVQYVEFATFYYVNNDLLTNACRIHIILMSRVFLETFHVAEAVYPNTFAVALSLHFLKLYSEATASVPGASNKLGD